VLPIRKGGARYGVFGSCPITPPTFAWWPRPYRPNLPVMRWVSGAVDDPT